MIIESGATNAPHPNPLPGGEGTSDANFRLFANPSGVSKSPLPLGEGRGEGTIYSAVPSRFICSSMSASSSSVLNPAAS